MVNVSSARPRERESHDSPRVRARKGEDGQYLTTGCVAETAYSKGIAFALSASGMRARACMLSFVLSA